MEIWTRNFNDENFCEYFINWLIDKGYLEEYEKEQEEIRKEINNEWLQEKNRLESKGVGDAPEAAWEKVMNRRQNYD